MKPQKESTTFTFVFSRLFRQERVVRRGRYPLFKRMMSSLMNPTLDKHVSSYSQKLFCSDMSHGIESATLTESNTETFCVQWQQCNFGRLVQNASITSSKPVEIQTKVTFNHHYTIEYCTVTLKAALVSSKTILQRNPFTRSSEKGRFRPEVFIFCYKFSKTYSAHSIFRLSFPIHARILPSGCLGLAAKTSPSVTATSSRVTKRGAIQSSRSKTAAKFE